ncbi:hypothetical protein V8E36_000114 [Tilletia maclaganii]
MMRTTAATERRGTAGVSTRASRAAAAASAATSSTTTRGSTAQGFTRRTTTAASSAKTTSAAAAAGIASAQKTARASGSAAKHPAAATSRLRPAPAVASTSTKTLQPPAPAAWEVEAASLKAKLNAAQDAGCSLYSKRDFTAAIPPLKEAAELSEALDKLYTASRAEAPAARLAAIDASCLQRRKNDVQRLDVLAVCYRMIKEMDLYQQTVRQMLSAVPIAQIQDLARAVGSTGVGEVFAMREWSRIAGVTQHVLDLTFFDSSGSPTDSSPNGLPSPSSSLTQAQDVTTAIQSISLGKDADMAEARLCNAAILEHYLAASLELNLHRTNGLSTFNTVVEACLAAYDKGSHPIRRARVILRRIEVDLLRPSIKIPGSVLLRDLEEALGWLEGDAHDDGALKSYTLQYRASAYLLRASILQHCAPAPENAGLDLVESCERASLLVQKLVTSSESDARTPVRSSRPSLEVTSRTNAGDAPVTPPRQIKPALPPARAVSGSQPSAGMNKTESAAPGSNTNFDDPARLCSQLETTCEMLSAFGHGLATLKLLRALRRLQQLECVKAKVNHNSYFKTCAQLASQYLSLGQTSRAKEVLAEAQRALREQDKAVGPGSTAKLLDADTQVRCLLAEVELFCALGNHQLAAASYEQAVNIAESIRPQRQPYRWQASLEQFHMIERQAFASQACSTLRLGIRDLDGAIVASMLCCRQWYKFSTLLGRLSAGQDRSAKSSSSSTSSARERTRNTPKDAIPGIEDPFGPAPGSEAQEAPALTADQLEMEPPKPLDDKNSRRQPALQHSTRHLPAQALVAVYWRCGRKLVDALLRCSQLLLMRGSGRDAELYATEAVDTAEALNARLTVSRALLQRAEVRLLMQRMEEGNEDLLRAQEPLHEVWIPEASESARIAGEAQLRAKATTQATQSFSSGQETLERLNALYSDVVAVIPSPAVKRQSLSKLGADGALSGALRGATPVIAAAGALLPNSQARLLIRQAQVALLEGDRATSASLLERVLALQVTEDVSTQSKSVLGQVALQHALRSLSKHQVLDSLADSVVSAPMISTSSKTTAASGCKAVIKALLSAHASFSEAIHCGCSTSDVPMLRDTAVSQALTIALLHTLEHGTKASAQRGDIGSISDFSSSVTVLREYMDAIGSKLAWSDFAIEEPTWLPAIHTQGTAKKGKGLFAPRPDKLDAFWSKVYAEGTQAGLMADNTQLPPNWSVVNISFEKSRNALVLTRQGGGARPLAVHLPVDRMSRREGEEEHLSIESAIAQMAALTRAINDGIHGAKNVDTREGKMQWWDERRRLDKELQELMTTMETTWLGVFKSVFADPTRASDEDQMALREKLAGVLKHACAPNSRGGGKIKLDRVVIECIARLRPGVATDEDLEDLIHFMMDALQVGGAPVAVDEVDVDDCVVEVRSALEEFWSRQSKAASEGLRRPEDDHHLFLVLDKDACAFPWESLAILRDQPVSRIPSIRFLQDRVKMAPLFCPQGADALETGHLYDFQNPRTFWLLNPAGDLPRTEARLTPWLSRKQKDDGWRGISGRTPIVDELPRALEENDVFTYFGHGGAEHYLRSARIRKLKKCAVTMLWGCSSGFLRDQGELDRTGTPINYMLAGSPALVANLWDMTDLELDRICETVFCKVGMMEATERKVQTLVPAANRMPAAGKEGRPMSLTRAVAEARRDCRLPYLSGGGCITYGVPVYFTTTTRPGP